MKVLILAGGYGSRLSELTDIKPKPMVEIGQHPILWHIMKIYAHYGLNDFVLLCGYKIEIIKYFFLNYYSNSSDLTINLKTNDIIIHSNYSEDWNVTIVNTGLNTSTGSRIKSAKNYIGDETFMLTYGDGLADIDIRDLLSFHKSHQKIVTMSAVMPEGRFGALSIDQNNNINSFVEKPKGDGNWINGGFYVMEPKFLDMIPDNDVMLEALPLFHAVQNQELVAYKHHGFWRAMDTMRDFKALNDLWNTGKAPWKVWV